MAEKVCNGCGSHHKEESSFAKELLSGYKKQCRNWFIVALVELAMIFGIVAIYEYKESLYDYTSYEFSTDGGGDAMYQEGDNSTFTNN